MGDHVEVRPHGQLLKGRHGLSLRVPWPPAYPQLVLPLGVPLGVPCPEPGGV